MSSRRVVVRGVVQGVGFRWATRREAASRGVSGWVRNADDGSVVAVVAGDDAAVDAMLAWLRRGPAGASVDSVDVRDGPPTAGTDFEIRD